FQNKLKHFSEVVYRFRILCCGCLSEKKCCSASQFGFPANQIYSIAVHPVNFRAAKARLLPASNCFGHSDRCMGIKSEDLPHIFDRYYRIETSHTRHIS
ncbi:MAG TPA: hypothetical protein VIM89_04850, partial [Mucilaginibacter sp.]